VTAASPRSFLFVPGDRRKLIDSALRSAAEALVFDLEDSVVEDRKPAARAQVAAVLRGTSAAVPCYVRVNGAETPHFSDDVAALAETPCAGLVIPKVESADLVRLAVARAAPMGVVLLVETPRGVLRALDLAEAAGDKLRALAFGAEDLRAAMQVDAADSDALVAFALPLIAVAAAAVPVPAIDAPELDITNEERLRQRAAAARALGFVAKFAIHPAQLPAIHDAFSATAGQRQWAERVSEAYERGRAEGRGSVRLDDRMIDAATLKRARDILERTRI